MKRIIFTWLALCAALVGAWLGPSIDIPHFKTLHVERLLVSPAHAQMSLLGAGGPLARSGGGGCSQATALLAAMDGSQSAHNADITTAVCGLASDGWYSGGKWLGDGLYVPSTSSTNFLVNWFNPTSSTASLNANGGSCTLHSSWGGVQGDGTHCYFDTGFNPFAAGGNWSTNSANMAACNYTGSTGFAGGVTDGSVYAVMNQVTGSEAVELNSSNFPSYSASSGVGVQMIDRTASANFVVYYNGVSQATLTDASMGAPGQNVYFLARNLVGTSNAWSSDNFGYFEFGGGANSTLQLSLYNRMHTLLVAVGAPSGC